MNVFELFATINLNDREYNRSLTKAEQRLDAFGKRAQTVGRNLSAALTLPILAIGGASIKAASDLEETTARFNTVFEGVNEAANESAQTLQDSFGQPARSARDLLGRTGDLLVGFGFTRDAALNLSTDVNQLAVDLASFNNVAGGADRASQALTSALLGETEALKSLGIVIRQEAVQDRVDLMRATGELTTETDLQAQAIATYDLILEQSGNAIGDYERTQDSFANQTRELKASFEDLRAEIGDNLLPIITPVIGQVNDAVNAFANLDEETQDFIVRATGFAAAIGPFLLVFGTIVSAVGASIAALRLFAPVLGVLAVAFFAFRDDVQNALSNFPEFVEGLQGVFGGLKDVLVEQFQLIVNGAENMSIAVQMFFTDMELGILRVLQNVSDRIPGINLDLTNSFRDLTLRQQDLAQRADDVAGVLIRGQDRLRDAVDRTREGYQQFYGALLDAPTQTATGEATEGLEDVPSVPSVDVTGGAAGPLGEAAAETVQLDTELEGLTATLLTAGEAYRSFNERRRDAVILANEQFGSEQRLQQMTEQARLKQEALGLSLPIEEVIEANRGTLSYSQSLLELTMRGAEAAQSQQEMRQSATMSGEQLQAVASGGIQQFITGLTDVAANSIATGQTVGAVFVQMALDVVNSIIDQIIAIQARIFATQLLAGATLNFAQLGAAIGAGLAAKGIIASIKSSIASNNAVPTSGGASSGVPSASAASSPAANAVIERLDSSVQRFGNYVDRLVTEGIQVQLTVGGSGTAVLRGT